MIYDYFRLTGAHDTVLLIMPICSLSLFAVMMFRTLMRDGMKFLTKIPSDDVLESLYKLRMRESNQLKNRIGIVRHGNSEDIDAQ